MLAAQLHGSEDLRVIDVPVPQACADGEVLVHVRAVGICGSDLLAYRAGAGGKPLILGHEFSGVVEQAFPGAVGAAGRPLTRGTRVAVDPAQPCGTCPSCRRGDPNLCPQTHFCGVAPDDGALRECLTVPASCCFTLPSELESAEGALLETLGVALHAVKLGHVRLGTRVAVLGAGPIGLCIAQVARLCGATVHVVEPLAWRLELAQRLGALPLGNNPAPIDVVFEAAWAGPAAAQAAELCRPGGRVVLVGIPADDRLDLSHGLVRRKGLTLVLCRRMKHTYPQAMELVISRAVNLKALISHHFLLAQAPEAFALNAGYAKGVMKVIIDV